MKKLNLTGVCLLACAGMQAAPLTPQQAIDRLNDGRMSIAGASRMETTPVWTARTANGTTTAYVFNMTDGKGYRILAADDAAYAVLGYSDTGSIDPDNMSPDLKWWLEQLGAQMEYYISKGATTGDVAPNYAPMAAIEPLTQSKWDQGTPYNNDCPKIGSSMTVTGCVATSMAQLMYYHKYPEKGSGSNSYGWDNGNKTLSMDFGAQAFDWNNMIDRYSGAYNNAQAKAVAYLMKSCGYSVNMNYGTAASGAQGVTISYALKKYFGYDPNVNVKFRVVYSATEWANMIYDNLKNVGPVILNGHAYEDAGHSFICDGYNGQGYFHFNWGWNGMSDGWFLLECMNPESQGTGGASMGAAFNYGLNGIFGIQKPTGDAEQKQYANLLMYGACTAQINGNRITYTRTPWYPNGWYCASDHSIQVNVGIIIEPVDGTPGNTITKSGTLFGATRVSMSPGSYYPTESGPVATLPSDLADGRYKVTIGVRDMNIAGAPYNPILCPYGAANYVYVTVKNGVKTVQNVATPTLEPEQLTLESALYYSRFARYKLKIKNPSDYELTETLSPALLNGNRVVMVGGVAPVTCAPNKDEEIIWDAKMTLLNNADRPTKATKYTLAIVNPVTNEVLGKYGEVTMEPNPGSATLRLNSLDIQNCETKSETLPSGSSIQVYDVPNGNNFTVDMSFFIYSGYFDGVISGTINKVNPESITSTELISDIYNQRKYMYEDDQEEISVPVQFSDANPEDLYSIQFSYSTGSTTRAFRSIYFRVKTSGVNDVIVDGNESVKYYNLQGMEIASPVKGQIVILKKGNKTFKIKL